METSPAETFHAPGERLAKDVLTEQVKMFRDNILLRKAFDSSNILILAINQYRQVIYANQPFLDLLGMNSLDLLIGKKPGEIVNCIHAGDHKNGCGASEACQHCSAVNLLLKSINDSKTSSGEIVITTKAKGFMLPMNLFETVTPFELNGEQFYIVALYDISDTKRRRTLERVFFHDILNTSGGLRGLISLLKEEIPSEYKPDLEFVEDTFSDLIDEVIAQRQLMEAENNELKIDFMTLRSDEVIDSIAKLYKNHEVAKNKAIIIEKNEKIIFKSDLVLLKRVLGNMVKNALEASGKGEKIVLGCRKRVSGGSKLLEFWVNNRQTMPKSTQLQVFNRSFSTKGSERGLGTYSMKLFGERYLKGEVSFESDDSSGTTFYLRLKC